MLLMSGSTARALGSCMTDDNTLHHLCSETPSEAGKIVFTANPREVQRRTCLNKAPGLQCRHRLARARPARQS